MTMKEFRDKYRLILTEDMYEDLGRVFTTVYERGYDDGERSALESPKGEGV